MESSAEFLDLKVSAILGTVWYREEDWLFLTKEFIYYVSCILYPMFCFVCVFVFLCYVFICFRCCLFCFLFVCVCVFHSMHLKLEKQSDVGFKECLLCVKHQETEAIVVRDSPPFCKVGIWPGHSSFYHRPGSVEGWLVRDEMPVVFSQDGWQVPLKKNRATGFPWWYWFTAWRSWYQP